jgi:hypothetical protein
MMSRHGWRGKGRLAWPGGIYPMQPVPHGDELS